jgi:4-amino-4-deoxy-L-arabinose transferase-like glycosyltransferase
VFAALLVLPPVGHHLIVKSDEARFALLARDMLRRGAWLEPEVEGQPYRNKPLLFPWIIAALSIPGRAVTEQTAQLPPAAAAVAAVVFTFLLGARLFTRRAGFWAALILATSASVFSHSQQILPDMLVVAFATMCGYAFWVAMSAPSRPALVGFYAALAFSVFAKGPVGLLPLLIAVAWLVAEHGLRGLGRLWSAAGLAVFAAVTLAWLVPFLWAGGQSFGEQVLIKDWLVTYVGLPLPRRVGSFLLDALIGFLPWSIVLPLALGWAVRERREPAVRFALLSFLLPLLVIVLSRSRLPRYLLPVYPGAALLVGWWAETRGASRTALRRALGWASFLGIAAAITVLPGLLKITDAEIPTDPDLAAQALPLLVCALLIGAVFLLGLRDGRPALLVLGGAVLMSVVLGYGVWLVNGWTGRAEDFRALAATVRRHAPDGDLRVFTQAKLLPLDFYFGRELPRLTSVEELRAYLAADARPTVLIDEQDLKITPRTLLRDLRVLETLRIHEQHLFLLGCSPSERATISPRCTQDPPPR